MSDQRPIRSIPSFGRLLYMSLEGLNKVSDKTQKLLSGLKENIQQARRLQDEEALLKLEGTHWSRASAEHRSGARKEKH